MHTASAGVDSIPKDTPVIKTFNRITAAFPGEKASLNVVVKAKDVTAPRSPPASSSSRRAPRAARPRRHDRRRHLKDKTVARSRSRSPARARTARP
jgi:hypothetical protein